MVKAGGGPIKLTCDPCYAVSAAVEHFESGVKEVDVKLSVRGGDRGIGAPRQKAEVCMSTFDLTCHPHVQNTCRRDD